MTNLASDLVAGARQVLDKLLRDQMEETGRIAALLEDARVNKSAMADGYWKRLEELRRKIEATTAVIQELEK